MEKAEGVKKAARARGALRYITTRLGGLLAPLILLSFMMAAVSVLSVSMALFMRRAIDSAVSGELGAIWTSLALMAGVTVLGLALKFISKALLARLDYRMEMRLRRTLLESILTRDLQRISAYHSGDIMNRLTNDISVISAAASGPARRM